jgi:uncharacterized membrane protein
MPIILDLVTIVSVGLLIGTEFAVSAFINPILAKLDDRAHARAIHLFAVRLGTVMPFWYGLSLLLLIVEAIVRHRYAGSLWLMVSCAIWAAVVLLTILILVPINNQFASKEADVLSPSAHRDHDRWEAMHRARIVALTASMIFFLAGIHL